MGRLLLLTVTFVLLSNHMLQGGSEKLSDEAIEETLEKVVKLLAYISDKDLFAEFYRKRLARRLLQVRRWWAACCFAIFCVSALTFLRLAYVSDKDLFAEFYRKRLARLLQQVRRWWAGGVLVW